jgi:hypothetical protein
METITFNSAQELKKSCKSKQANGQQYYDFSKIKSINGYTFGSLSPDITNKSVSVYDVELQDTKHFYSPFSVEFNN